MNGTCFKIMKQLLLTIAAVVLVGCGESKKQNIWEAAASNDTNTIDLLIALGQNVNAKDGGLGTPIHHAAIEGHKALIKYLIEKGAKINEINSIGYTPLHYAAQAGNNEVVEMLIANGAELNLRDNIDGGPLYENIVGGNTPLMHAVFAYEKDTIELLLKSGAEVNLLYDMGFTALDIINLKAEAVKREEQQKLLSEIADLLRKHGAKTGAELKAEGK